jgi:hypothetical protein
MFYINYAIMSLIQAYLVCIETTLRVGPSTNVLGRAKKLLATF